MNRLQFLKSCGAALAAAAVTPVASFAKEEEGDEKELKLSECPEKVRKTIKAFAGEGKIMEVTKERKGDQWVYEAEFVRNGQKLEIQVAQSGKLIKIEPGKEDEEEKEEKGEKGEKREGKKEKNEEEDGDDEKSKKREKHEKGEKREDKKEGEKHRKKHDKDGDDGDKK